MLEIPKIDFDKQGNVIGEYYGECPLCEESNNLVHQNNGKWVCYKCRFAKNKDEVKKE